MPNARPTKRSLQARSTKARIFDIAAELISERGFENVTVDQICARAGVAKGGFYHHFTSKDEIVIEAYRQIDDLFSQALQDLDPAAGPRGRILFTTGFMARTASDKGAAFCRQIYRSQIERGTSFFISPERPFFASIFSALSQGMDQGVFQARPGPERATRLVLSLARGIIYDWSMVDAAYDIDQFMHYSMATLLDGMRTPAPAL